MDIRASSLPAVMLRCAIGVLFMTSLSAAARAQLSNIAAYTPGPNAGTRGPGWTVGANGADFHIFYRNPDAAHLNQIWFRTTDGVNDTAWGAAITLRTTTASYPAAATRYDSTGKIVQGVNIFIRGNRTDDGTLDHIFVTAENINTTGLFTSCVPLSYTTDAAPAAGFVRDSTGMGRIVVFWRDKATHRLKYAHSANDFQPSTYVTGDLSQTGDMTSGPVAVNEKVPGSNATRLIVYHRTTLDSTGKGAIVSASTTNLTWSFNQPADALYTSRSTASPTDRSDPALVSTPGACILEPESTEWLSYHVAALQAMRAGIVKFHMSYDGQWQDKANPPNPFAQPRGYACSLAQIKDAAKLGAKVIILRSAESRTGGPNMTWFLNSMGFPDDLAHSIVHLPSLVPGVKFVIEVGNEPDNVPAGGAWGIPGGDDTDARQKVKTAFLRDQAIDTAVRLIGTPSLANFLFIVSLPTDHGGDYTYLDEFTKADAGGRKLMELYPGIGVHAYAGKGSTVSPSLYWNHADRPLAALHYCLARMPLGEQVFMTEAGINNNTPGNPPPTWNQKGANYRGAMWAAPSSVRGWTFFCLSAHPRWNTFDHYCLDKQYTDRVISSVQNVTISATERYTSVGYEGAGFYLTPSNSSSGVFIRNSNMKGSGTELDGLHYLRRIIVNGNTEVVEANHFAINEPIAGMNAYDTTNKPGRVDKYPLQNQPGLPASTILGGR